MTAIIDNVRLPKKLLIAFLFLGALVALVAANGLRVNQALEQTNRDHVARDLPMMAAVAELMSDIKELRIIVYSYHNAVDPADQAKLVQRLTKGEAEVHGDIEAIAKVAPANLASAVSDMRARAAALTDVNQRVFATRAGGDVDGSLKLVKGEAKDRSHDAIDQAQALMDGARKHAEGVSAAAIAASRVSMAESLGLALVAFAGLAGVWLLIGRTVSRPMGQLARVTASLAEGGDADVPCQVRGDELGEIARAVECFRQAAVDRAAIDARLAAEQRQVTDALAASLGALAKGDLTAEVHGDFPPAYAALKTNFNGALVALRALTGSVIDSAEVIHSGSGEIARASEDLARRTEANAANLEESAAALGEMDGRLRAAAELSVRTAGRADEAIATVKGGRSVADDAVQAMGRVSDSAKGIDSVIEGLDKIAFQTRVLAMNAAVEAGRAGEAGRGFAVVADLVSALAMRSEEEAKLARKQLTTTQSDIVAAVEAVQKVDGALVGISEGVRDVHVMLGQIATDNQAQSSAISQISTAVSTMDRSTQQNAAMVEETSAAARALSTEVEGLAARANGFDVGRRPAPERTTQRAAASPRHAGVAPLPRAVATSAFAPSTVTAVSDAEWATF